MSDHRNPDGDDAYDDDVDPAFDARARAAGRAVREPAPADGLGRVRAAKRRRSIVQAVAVVAVAAIAVGGLAGLTRSDDETLQPADTVPTATLDGGLASSVPTTDDAAAPVSAPPTQASATETSQPAEDASQNPSEPASTTPPDSTGTTAGVSPDTTAPSTVPYEPAGQYAGPSFDDRTTAVTEPLADGLYFSQAYTSDGNTVTFRLVQRIRGQACIDEFGEEAAANECASDSGTISEPSATVTMTADAVTTSVILFDNGPSFEAYRVPADEFIRLAAGQAPSAGAPDDYTWFPWGTYVTIENGRVVSAHQQFQS